MNQNPYLNNEMNVNNLTPYPNGTILGGTSENLTRPRPMYNMMPHHNLPTYGLEMNTFSSNNSNNTINPNSYKKMNAIIKEIMKNSENPNIYIIII